MIDLSDILEAAAYIERSNKAKGGGRPPKTHCKNGHDLSVTGRQKYVTNQYGVQVKAGRECLECKRAKQRKGEPRPNAQKPRKKGSNPFADDYQPRDRSHHFHGGTGRHEHAGDDCSCHVQRVEDVVRLILHKTKFPDSLKGTCEFWFRYKGEDFGVSKNDASAKYPTWEVIHAGTMGVVREDYDLLDHVRRYGAEDADVYLLDLKFEQERNEV